MHLCPCQGQGRVVDAWRMTVQRANATRLRKGRGPRRLDDETAPAICQHAAPLGDVCYMGNGAPRILDLRRSSARCSIAYS